MAAFIKYHTCLSYLFSPVESRFVLHMLESEFLKSRGYMTDWNREEYMKRMGLKEYNFDKSIKRLIKLGLLIKTNNEERNKVFYSFNVERYEKFVQVLSQIRNVDNLIRFCNTYFNTESPRLVDDITQGEIQPFLGMSDLKKR